MKKTKKFISTLATLSIFLLLLKSLNLPSFTAPDAAKDLTGMNITLPELPIQTFCDEYDFTELPVQ